MTFRSILFDGLGEICRTPPFGSLEEEVLEKVGEATLGRGLES